MRSVPERIKVAMDVDVSGMIDGTEEDEEESGRAMELLVECEV